MAYIQGDGTKGAGVKGGPSPLLTAELAPIDLLQLQAGAVSAGVKAEVEALELDLVGEPVLALAANGSRVIPLDWKG